MPLRRTRKQVLVGDSAGILGCVFLGGILGEGQKI